MSELKPEFKNDNEFECIRRIACKLGLSMPESDDEVLRLTHYRRIESSINKLFNDTITEQDKVIGELVDKIQLNTEILNAIMERKPLQGSDYHAISCTIKNNELLIAKHKQSKGE